MKTKKPGKIIPIKNLEFQHFIRKLVQRLQNQDFKQQNDIKPLGASFGSLRLFSSFFKNGSESLPVNGGVKLTQWVTYFIDTIQGISKSKDPSCSMLKFVDNA